MFRATIRLIVCKNFCVKEKKSLIKISVSTIVHVLKFFFIYSPCELKYSVFALNKNYITKIFEISLF